MALFKTKPDSLRLIRGPLPPAPRAVAIRTKEKVVMLSLAALLLLVAAAIAMAAVKRHTELRTLVDRGVVTTGTIVDKDTHRSGKSRKYDVVYRFSREKTIVETKESIDRSLWDGLSVGQSCLVTYDPENENLQRLFKITEDDVSSHLNMCAIGFSVGFLAAGALAWFSLWEIGRRKRLLSEGLLVEAVVRNIGPSVGKNRRRKTVFEVHAPAGVVFEASHTLASAEAAQISVGETVGYLLRSDDHQKGMPLLEVTSSIRLVDDGTFMIAPS